MNLDDAINSGAQALFGEKYEDEVRVLTMGEKSFSVELCGGTHVERTGDIGVFVIVNQSSVASGIRRIEAIGGKQALEYINEVREVTDSLQSKLNVPADALLEKVEALIEENKKLKKSGGSQPNSVKVIFSETYDVNDWQLQVEQVSTDDNKILRGLVG
jgi:alanyl-tRNA synthetase